jgi:probable rRNA maturation factor
VEVLDRQSRVPRSVRIVGAMVRQVVRTERDDVDEVSVVLADDPVLEDLNRRFRGKPRPTDVLAFPGEAPGPYRHLGEVIISTDRALAQAPTYAHPVADELARLLVHGLLHLLGYDHDSAPTRRQMREAEDRHLQALHPWIAKLRERTDPVNQA